MTHDKPKRTVPLPEIGDDFDWHVRDYDSFRMFMLEELAARFPERRRWTPADIEVVIAEVLAAVLDQLSDMTDRVAAEAYLETARQPETVYRLLKLIGYDAVQEAGLSGPSAKEQLLSRWMALPELMEAARITGPRLVHHQRRMVTVADYTHQLEEHPLVMLTNTWQTWGGSWPVVWVAVRLRNDVALDEVITVKANFEFKLLPKELQSAISRFHLTRGLFDPLANRLTFTPRRILGDYLDAYRLSGQEVVLLNAVLVSIKLDATIILKPSYLPDEVRHLAEQALGDEPEGFFAPGRLRFGEGIHVGDIYQVLTGLAGVQRVIINLFKRSGNLYTDQTASGYIRLERAEMATGMGQMSLRFQTGRGIL